MQITGNEPAEAALEGVSLDMLNSFADFRIGTMCTARTPDCFTGECPHCSDAIHKIMATLPDDVFASDKRYKVLVHEAHNSPRTADGAASWEECASHMVTLVVFEPGMSARM